ncbi:MAG TPA: hypothetical protein VFI31_28515 [Pirellulales bacterium]|nr:hypothetical protein [Pirellulales bacterium]
MVQKLAQRLRRLAWPVRRAMSGAVHRVLDHHIQLWLSRTAPARIEQERASGEMLLVADAMVRELVRLQNQLQTLEQAIVERGIDHDFPPSVERRKAA